MDQKILCSKIRQNWHTVTCANDYILSPVIRNISNLVTSPKLWNQSYLHYAKDISFHAQVRSLNRTVSWTLIILYEQKSLHIQYFVRWKLCRIFTFLHFQAVRSLYEWSSEDLFWSENLKRSKSDKIKPTYNFQRARESREKPKLPNLFCCHQPTNVHIIFMLIL